jgi:hypothetical protein
MREFTRREFLKALGAGMAALALSPGYPGGMALAGGAAIGVGVERFDSGTRVVREVAEALTGRGRSILECYPPGSALYLWFLSLLPEELRIAGIEWGMALGVGNSPRQLASLEVGSLCGWCLRQYPASRYKAIIVGSPNGGIAHLAALLRAPFLTSSFGVSFARAKSDPDDLAAYQEFGRRLAEPILQSRRGEEFEVINHYDPLHDRNLVKYVNRLRIKLWELPQAYQEFILRNLAPQGKIILVSCNYRWLQYVLGERFFLQIGGLGGISPQEYLERWNLDLPLQERQESEWGCPEGFASSVREFAARRGIELVEIGFAHPQEYSLLAYRAYLECEGVRKEVVFLDSFNHQNPRTNIQTGIPGLWLPFNTEDSLAFAREFLDLEGKRFKKIYLTVLPSFARSPDTPTLDRWLQALSGHGKVEVKLELLGISSHLFPADTLAPFRLVAQLERLRQRYRLPKPLELGLSTLERLLSSKASHALASKRSCRPDLAGKGKGEMLNPEA